jgi:hypothetical protein
MLDALRAWWATGTNTAALAADADVSAVPPNVSLVDAERFARAAEPGTGDAQPSVLDQLDAAR